MSPIQEDDLRAALRSDPHEPLDAYALAAEVTGRGRTVIRRRRIAGVLATAAAVVAVVVAVNQLAFGPPQALDPAGPPTASVVSPAPTTPPPTLGEPTTRPEPTHNGGTAQTEGSDVEMPQLLHEGATLAQLEAQRPGVYQGNEDFEAVTGIAGDLQPCHGGPEDQPLTTPVVESKAIGQSYGSGARNEGLIVLADADVAQAAMAEIRQRLACGDDGAEEYPNTATYPLDGAWGDGFRTNVWTHGPGFTSYYYIARVGRAIMWSEQSGDGGGVETQPSADVDAMLRAPLEHLYPQLCRYTEAGCSG